MVNDSVVNAAGLKCEIRPNTANFRIFACKSAFGKIR